MSFQELGQSETERNMLQAAAACCNMDAEDLLSRMNEMKNQEILQQHPYSISQGSDGRFRTYVSDASQSKGRRQIAKSTLEALNEAIIADFKKCKDEKSVGNMHLENLYEHWMIWRRDTGTDPKTVKENSNDWNRFLSKSELAKKRVKEITMFDLEDFFFSITQGHAITFKRLSNIRSVLSGVFKYAIRLKIVTHSIVFDVDYKQFRTRCRPSTSNKSTYTDDERKAISAYLEDKTDVYSLAISFAFRLCLRIGELQVIKKADITQDSLSISRSIRRRQAMNDDLTFGKIRYDVDPRIKGNTTEGARTVALTPKARAIAKKAIELYPEGEYLFTRNGSPIIANTFNEHLERICKTLSIPYRSSHQIRFTTVTNLLEAGVPITQISHDLGHSEVRTTYLYARQRRMDERSKAITAQVQDV